MEGPRGVEFPKEQSDEKTDGGFSEKRIARVLEGKQHDNSQVKKRKPLVQAIKQKVIHQIARRDYSQQQQPASNLRVRTAISVKEKILAAFDKNAGELSSIVQELGRLQQAETRRHEQLLQEAFAKQKVQGQLLTLLAHEQKGDMSDEDLSKQLANLVK